MPDSTREVDTCSYAFKRQKYKDANILKTTNKICEVNAKTCKKLKNAASQTGILPNSDRWQAETRLAT